jgi:hypothetical protein
MRRNYRQPRNEPLEHGGGNERGTALLCALMVTALLTTLGASLVMVVITETLVGAHHRASHEALYGAEAGIERAIGELRQMAAWQAVPAAGTATALPELNDGTLTPALPDGRRLDLVRLTADRQAESDRFYPDTPDRPAWRLFGHTSLDRLIAGDAGTAPPYIIVWIADDPGDLDGDPARDSNDILLVRCEASGARATHRAIEAAIRRQSTLDAAGAGGAMRSDVNVIAWREVR